MYPEDTLIKHNDTEPNLLKESARRRTFAIISHPDAGKTTLTEKFLLYGGAILQAGSIKARDGQKHARSDWMGMEQQRGISITSTVLQFSFGNTIYNLLDTPGHRDFSEDTYRVLTACDSAIMVLDVAKGIEAQTLKLFEVCRSQNIPIISFINKFDRSGRETLELLDEIEDLIKLTPTPVTWPVGIAGDFKGVIDTRDDSFVSWQRTARGATMSQEERLSIAEALKLFPSEVEKALEECELLRGVGSLYNKETFLEGTTSPLFVGSAITNFGVKDLLNAVKDIAPRPKPRLDAAGSPRPLESDFSGFVFKIQANMNPAHRDHVAFVRVCSGEFDRGMNLVNASTGKTFATKYAASMFGAERFTLEKGYPGDIIGLVNASELNIGDTLYAKTPVKYPEVISFAPEIFAYIRSTDTSRYKQFNKGLERLEREGVIQILEDSNRPTTPLLGAVGQMQYEVLTYRLESEFGAKIELQHTSYKHVRSTDPATALELAKYGGILVVTRRDGSLLALFENEFRLKRIESEHPNWTLSHVVGAGKDEYNAQSTR